MKVKLSKPGKERFTMFYLVKKRKFINLILNFNTIQLFKKDVKLFNCEKIYNKVFIRLSKSTKITKKKVYKTLIKLSTQNTPNASGGYEAQ